MDPITGLPKALEACLTKVKPGVVETTSKKWVYVDHEKLLYWQGNKKPTKLDKTPKQGFILSRCGVAVGVKSVKRDLAFKVIDMQSGNSVVFAAGNPREFEIWVEFLRLNCEYKLVKEDGNQIEEADDASTVFTVVDQAIEDIIADYFYLNTTNTLPNASNPAIGLEQLVQLMHLIAPFMNDSASRIIFLCLGKEEDEKITLHELLKWWGEYSSVMKFNKVEESDASSKQYLDFFNSYYNPSASLLSADDSKRLSKIIPSKSITHPDIALKSIDIWNVHHFNQLCYYSIINMKQPILPSVQKSWNLMLNIDMVVQSYEDANLMNQEAPATKLSRHWNAIYQTLIDRIYEPPDVIPPGQSKGDTANATCLLRNFDLACFKGKFHHTAMAGVVSIVNEYTLINSQKSIPPLHYIEKMLLQNSLADDEAYEGSDLESYAEDANDDDFDGYDSVGAIRAGNVYVHEGLVFRIISSKVSNNALKEPLYTDFELQSSLTSGDLINHKIAGHERRSLETLSKAIFNRRTNYQMKQNESPKLLSLPPTATLGNAIETHFTAQVTNESVNMLHRTASHQAQYDRKNVATRLTKNTIGANDRGADDNEAFHPHILLSTTIDYCGFRVEVFAPSQLSHETLCWGFPTLSPPGEGEGLDSNLGENHGGQPRRGSGGHIETLDQIKNKGTRQFSANHAFVNTMEALGYNGNQFVHEISELLSIQPIPLHSVDGSSTVGVNILNKSMQLHYCGADERVYCTGVNDLLPNDLPRAGTCDVLYRFLRPEYVNSYCRNKNTSGKDGSIFPGIPSGAFRHYSDFPSWDLGCITVDARIKRGDPTPIRVAASKSSNLKPNRKISSFFGGRGEETVDDVAIVDTATVNSDSAERFEIALRACTELYTSVIPELASKLDQMLLFPLQSHDLTKLLHMHGVNCRMLGKLYTFCTAVHSKHLLMCEMVARACKTIFGNALRMISRHNLACKLANYAPPEPDQEGSQTEECEMWVDMMGENVTLCHVNFFNIVLGNTEHTIRMWTSIIADAVFQSFNIEIPFDTMTSIDNHPICVPENIHFPQLFQALQVHCSVIFADDCIFKKFNKDCTRYAPDALIGYENVEGTNKIFVQNAVSKQSEELECEVEDNYHGSSNAPFDCMDIEAIVPSFKIMFSTPGVIQRIIDCGDLFFMLKMYSEAMNAYRIQLSLLYLNYPSNSNADNLETSGCGDNNLLDIAKSVPLNLNEFVSLKLQNKIDDVVYKILCCRYWLGDYDAVIALNAYTIDAVGRTLQNRKISKEESDDQANGDVLCIYSVNAAKMMTLLMCSEFKLGNVQKAMKYYEAVTHVYNICLGTWHPIHSIVASTLSELYVSSGAESQGLLMCLHGQRSILNTYSKSHIVYANHCCQVGNVLFNQHAYVEALKEYQEAFHIYEKYVQKYKMLNVSNGSNNTDKPVYDTSEQKCVLLMLALVSCSHMIGKIQSKLDNTVYALEAISFAISITKQIVGADISFSVGMENNLRYFVIACLIMEGSLFGKENKLEQALGSFTNAWEFASDYIYGLCGEYEIEENGQQQKSEPMSIVENERISKLSQNFAFLLKKMFVTQLSLFSINARLQVTHYVGEFNKHVELREMNYERAYASCVDYLIPFVWQIDNPAMYFNILSRHIMAHHEQHSAFDTVDWGLVLERKDLKEFFEDTVAEILESSVEENAKLKHTSTDVFMSCVIQCCFIMGIIQGSVVKHI